MQILFIRHAIAQDRIEFAKKSKYPDDLRPLTGKGKQKMYKSCIGLQKLVPKVTRLVHSPLLRAKQTADILSEVYPNTAHKRLESLAPDGEFDTIIRYLKQCYIDDKNATIVLVGHEPDLSEFIMWALSKKVNDWLYMKKGSACMVEFRDGVKAGDGDLKWLMTATQLRMIAKAV